MGSLPTPAPPLRLAILETDTPVPGVRAKYGTYGGVFASLFTRACASLDPPATLESQLDLSYHDVVDDLDSYPDPTTLDAVLITGSKHNSFEDHEWIQRLVRYTRRVLEGGGDVDVSDDKWTGTGTKSRRRKVKVIGVCFGHQIVARALGTKVGRSDRGWEVAVVEMGLSEEGKRIFEGRETLRIQQMHRDAVYEHPPGTLPLAHTDVCAVQGMYIPGRMIAVQGHPEFTEPMVAEILKLRHDSHIIGDDLYEDAMRRVGDEHDGVLIARAFLKFLRE